MRPQERTASIYKEIRRLDAETSANADKAKKQDEQETDGTLT
jgi:hypothetical protein